MRANNKKPIIIGSCGYSYPEWTEAGFYPNGQAASDMLLFYSTVFPATELNFTWYQMPKAAAIRRMRDSVPETFLFTAKLTRTMTHEIDDNWPEQVTAYRNGIAPLVQNHQLASVLIQLPPFFQRTKNNRYHLSHLLDQLKGLPVAVEFRHRSWACDPVFAELEKRQVALVCIDAPELDTLFPPLTIATHKDFFYLRLHGRNKAGWRSGNMQQKFNYNYSDEELQHLVIERIMPLQETTAGGFIFFNNHVAAQAPRNALSLLEILRQQGMETG